MSHVNATHLEVRPTHQDDDAGDGMVWTVYAVNRVYFVSTSGIDFSAYITGPFEETSQVYSQHGSFDEADQARKTANY